MKVIMLWFFIGVSVNAFSNSRDNDFDYHQNREFSSKILSSEVKIDSVSIVDFLIKHPKLNHYKVNLFEVYRRNQYQSVWFTSNKINALGDLLYKNICNLSAEGLQITIPYKEELDLFFYNTKEEFPPNVEMELLISSLYFFYTQHVFLGLEDRTTTDLAWYIPRKTQSYVSYLDTLIQNPSLLSKNDSKMFGQYYRLKKALKKYREIESLGKWHPIIMLNSKPIAANSSSDVVNKVRERLFLLGYLKSNSNSMNYDKELMQAVMNYKKNMGISPDLFINARLVSSLNVPLKDRIKSIIFNMERCRWISSDFYQAEEYIFINIPSYEMNYFKDRKRILNSKVVVGKVMNKTVIFSGMLQYVVFSPYWNVPKSIINKEIMPAIKKNKNYLAQHNMEWNDGNIRQKPGPKNSLGLVKFLFPNSNSIYLHDTPSKSLFKKEKRAFSHGCIRLEKPIELAYLLVKDDKNWTMEKLNDAFHSKKEIWYRLKNKIPVYIGYFTAWVNDSDEVQFYDDVYARDECLTSYLFSEQ